MWLSVNGFEQESVIKDSDTKYVQLVCLNEQHNSESSHEEEKYLHR